MVDLDCDEYEIGDKMEFLVCLLDLIYELLMFDMVDVNFMIFDG